MEQFLSSMTNPEAWVALLTLTLLEVILGIDNIVFISIVAGRLPEDQQKKGRTVGLMLALVMRILLLLSIVWIMQLTKPLFAIMGYEFSGKDLILLGGGLFLIFKATHEIHNRLEGEEEGKQIKRKHASFMTVIVEIALIDIVFSLDSVITAVGMTNFLWVMITAVIISIGFMLIFATWVSEFIEKHPSIKMLALSFLVLIGVNLIAEGLGHHIPRGYTYFAMGFSIAVEMLNLKIRGKKPHAPVHLRPNLPAGIKTIENRAAES